MFKVIEQERSDVLRKRMEKAGCVFQFVILQAEPDAVAKEVLHRQALQGLHGQVVREALEWHRTLLQKPEYATLAAPQMNWASDQAIACRVPADELQALSTSLYGSFCQPPYGTRFAGGETEAQALFQEWKELLGLVEADQPEVINWVANLQLDYEDDFDPTASWSSYFDDGLEWWGVWCLTIWNPKRRTFGALAASTTD